MYRVVFIDDEFLILEGMKKIIDWDKLGFEVAGCATSANEGIDLINRENPHLIITDIRMRGTSGLEMIEMIKNSGYNGYIIILSGYRDFEYAKKAIENGVFRYLVKPLNVDELRESISSVVKLLDESIGNIDIKPSTIKEAVEYVNRHYTEDMSLNKLAKKYHFELSHFSKLFKKYTGETYSEYITKLRIELSKRYITESELSVEEISEKVGYKSPRHFREQFKKYVDMSPGKFRKGSENNA